MNKALYDAARKIKRLVKGRKTDNIPPLFNEAVNFERESIFIAVPKTGTTSIRYQLWQAGPKLIDVPHLTIRQVRDGLYTHQLLQSFGRNTHFPTRAAEVPSDDEIRAEAADIFQRFFKFGSVRNPWARVVSLYQRREGIEMADNMDFEAFCSELRYASDTCFYPTRALHQLDWLTDADGTLLVDYVLRLEDLDAGLAEINARTNGRLGLEERHYNANPKSASASYRSMYTDKAREAVAEACRRDIEYFGYEF